MVLSFALNFTLFICMVAFIATEQNFNEQNLAIGFTLLLGVNAFKGLGPLFFNRKPIISRDDLSNIEHCINMEIDENEDDAEYVGYLDKLQEKVGKM